MLGDAVDGGGGGWGQSAHALWHSSLPKLCSHSLLSVAADGLHADCINNDASS